MPQCEGKTKKGNQCRRKVAKGCRRCHQHVEVFETSTCAICICEMDDDGTKKTLRCGHQFHSDCIVEWLSRSDTCPHCRKKVGAATRRWADRIIEERNETDSEWVPEDDSHWQRLGNDLILARRRRRRRRVGVDTTRRNRVLIHLYSLYDRMLEIMA